MHLSIFFLLLYLVMASTDSLFLSKGDNFFPCEIIVSLFLKSISEKMRTSPESQLPEKPWSWPRGASFQPGPVHLHVDSAVRCEGCICCPFDLVP